MGGEGGDQKSEKNKLEENTIAAKAETGKTLDAIGQGFGALAEAAKNAAAPNAAPTAGPSAPNNGQKGPSH